MWIDLILVYSLYSWLIQCWQPTKYKILVDYAKKSKSELETSKINFLFFYQSPVFFIYWSSSLAVFYLCLGPTNEQPLNVWRFGFSIIPQKWRLLRIIIKRIMMQCRFIELKCVLCTVCTSINLRMWPYKLKLVVSQQRIFRHPTKKSVELVKTYPNQDIALFPNIFFVGTVPLCPLCLFRAQKRPSLLYGVACVIMKYTGVLWLPNSGTKPASVSAQCRGHVIPGKLAGHREIKHVVSALYGPARVLHMCNMCICVYVCTVYTGTTCVCVCVCVCVQYPHTCHRQPSGHAPPPTELQLQS